MNIRSLCLGALSALMLAGLGLPTTAAAAPPSHDEPLLIGHRGAAGVAPENTLPAIKAGSQSGAEFIEIDVQLSRDGVPFIFHDDTPARTTNVEQVFPGREHQPITSFTWDELQQLDAGSYFSAAYAGERIPHLDQVPQAITGTTGVFIEIKSPKNSPGVEEVVATALEQERSWSPLLDAGRIEVLGFDAESNQRFAQLAPEVPLQQLAGTVPDAATLEGYSRFADAFGTSYRNLDAAGAERVRQAGLGLGVYTVNSTSSADAARQLGVERITGDFPAQLSRHFSGRDPFPGKPGLVIHSSVNDVPGNDLQPETGEHVVLNNSGHRPVDASGYLLRDAANNLLQVPAGYTIPAGGQLRVYPGPGTNSADAFYADSGSAILNNGGDSLGLWNGQGKLVDTFAN